MFSNNYTAYNIYIYNILTDIYIIIHYQVNYYKQCNPQHCLHRDKRQVHVQESNKEKIHQIILIVIPQFTVSHTLVILSEIKLCLNKKKINNRPLTILSSSAVLTQVHVVVICDLVSFALVNASHSTCILPNSITQSSLVQYRYYDGDGANCVNCAYK